jgi:hypothetical protein
VSAWSALLSSFAGVRQVLVEQGVKLGVKVDEVATRSGFTKLGVENIGGIVTRGVLLDVAAAKGVEMLDAGYEITVTDLKEAMKRQGVTIRTGDAVLIHTGWGKLWMKDNAKYKESEPGIGIAAAEWLAKANPILIGSDTWVLKWCRMPIRIFSSRCIRSLSPLTGFFFWRTSISMGWPETRPRSLPSSFYR